jgi:hypothetical protein
VHWHAEKGAKLAITRDATPFHFCGAAKPAGYANWASYWLGLASTNTYWSVQPVTKGDVQLVFTTPAQAANLAAGDYIYLRTGQRINASITEPSSEINRVRSVNASTGIVTLYRPAARDYAQEYFVGAAAGGTDGNVGKTDTTNRGVPANNGPAPFGVAKITDRTLLDVGLHNIEFDSVTCRYGFMATGAVAGLHVTGLRGVLGGSGSNSIEFTDGLFEDWNISVEPRVLRSGRWLATTATGCTHIRTRALYGRSNENTMLELHVHEDSAACIFEDTRIHSGRGQNDLNIIDVRGGCWDITIDGYEVVSQGDPSPVFISSECRKGRNILRGGRQAVCTDASKGVLCRAAGWTIEDHHPAIHVHRAAAGTGFIVTDPDPGGSAPGQHIGAPIVLTARLSAGAPTVVLGVIPANYMIWDGAANVFEVFDGSGTARCTLGWDGSTAAVATVDSVLDLKLSGPMAIPFQDGYFRFNQQVQTPPRVLTAYGVFGGSAPTVGRVEIKVILMPCIEF